MFTGILNQKVDFNWLFQGEPVTTLGLIIFPKEVRWATTRWTSWIETLHSSPAEPRAFLGLPSFSQERVETTKITATTITDPEDISTSQDYRPTCPHD